MDTKLLNLSIDFAEQHFDEVILNLNQLTSN